MASIVCVAVLALATLQSARASSLEFDAYRLIQYQVTMDQTGQSDKYSAAMEHTVQHFGSQSTSINSLSALHYSAFLSAKPNDTTLAKKVCVIHYDDLVKLGDASNLQRQLDRKGTAGLVVLLLDSDRAHGGDKGSVAEQESF